MLIWDSTLMKNSRKVAVIIAHSYGEPFESLQSQIQPKIWEELRREGIDVFYALGNRPNLVQILLDQISCKARYSKNFWIIQRLMDRYSLAPMNRHLPSVKEDGDILRIDVPEGHRYMGVKIIAALKFLYEEGYEIVYRTTLSTIIIKENFQEVISAIHLNAPYYGGTRLKFMEPNIVSGANLFMNRLALKDLLENINRWHHWDLDDVAIGKIFNGRIRISELNSINIDNLGSAKALDFRKLNKAIHIRCKSNLTPRNDSEIMLEVLSRLTEFKENPV